MALDPDMLSLQDLLNRIEELESAAAAALHVNEHLNREVEKCVRATEAAKAEAQTWRQRARWLTSQLVQANKQLRAVTSGQQRDFDEAAALADLMDQAAQATPPDIQSSSSQQVQPSASQELLLKKLVAKGHAAGWLINPSEIHLGAMLGEGEFGITYKATWRGATVAVKCVRARSATELGNFLREVEALCGLRHPHVLPFLGACLTGGPERMWLVTEYMEQGNLSAWMYPHKHTHQQAQHPQHDQGSTTQHLSSGTYPSGLGPQGTSADYGSSGGAQGRAGVGRTKPLIERVRMAYEVAQGLIALESLHPPLLHRDIKPSNIYVDGGGHARVGDFGLARRLLPEAVANLTGETGTYLYMAPEVMRHEVYDSKADVWSWGVLLVELLSLQTPYAWTYMLPEQIALGVAEEQLAPLVPDHVPVDLQAIARLVLSFSPEERPPFSMITHEMGTAYQRMLQQQAQPSGGVPALLASVGRQLSRNWTGLLSRLYATNMLPAASGTSTTAKELPAGPA